MRTTRLVQNECSESGHLDRGFTSPRVATSKTAEASIEAGTSRGAPTQPNERGMRQTETRDAANGTANSTTAEPPQTWPLFRMPPVSVTSSKGKAAEVGNLKLAAAAWVMLSLMPIPQGLNQYEQVWGNPPRPGLRPHTGPGASRTTRAGASLKSPHEHKSETWREPNETSSGSAWESKPNHGKCWSDCCACARARGRNRK